MIPRRRRLWPSCLLLALLFGGVLYSVEQTDRPPFEQADRNDDGMVDAREARHVGVPRAEIRREELHGGSGLSPSEWNAVDLYRSTGVS